MIQILKGILMDERDNREEEYIHRLDYDEVDILLNETNTIVFQLTLISHQLFSKIKPSELTHQSWLKNKSATNVNTFLGFSNNVVNWVISTVLNEPEFENRTFKLLRFIKMVILSHELHNFFLCRCILRALSDPVVSELKISWDILSTGERSLINQYKTIRKLHNPDGDYLLYRKYMETVSLPAIPSLDVLFKDMILADEVLTDYLTYDQVEYICFEKITRFTEIISHLLPYQNHKYHLKKNPGIFNFFYEILVRNPIVKEIKDVVDSENLHSKYMRMLYPIMKMNNEIENRIILAHQDSSAEEILVRNSLSTSFDVDIYENPEYISLLKGNKEESSSEYLQVRAENNKFIISVDKSESDVDLTSGFDSLTPYQYISFPQEENNYKAHTLSAITEDEIVEVKSVEQLKSLQIQIRNETLERMKFPIYSLVKLISKGENAMSDIDRIAFIYFIAEKSVF
eukprot:TRINITY_DN5482_c0_g1_i1.p1 TRINITY_DN5482_c0_g1~~TRINITY_DN5482_c0_g1_i1.p1  ORF type:complete len:458 (-),score=87.40 TRINITY_DN5482_c0_g1_i1:914-2287(-)